MTGYEVFCEICGHGWDERSPDVRWLNIDRAWTCTDEAECFTRVVALAGRVCAQIETILGDES